MNPVTRKVEVREKQSVSEPEVRVQPVARRGISCGKVSIAGWFQRSVSELAKITGELLGAKQTRRDALIGAMTASEKEQFTSKRRRSRTKKAEPPPNYGVNRDSGTDRANGGWLRRLVRHSDIKSN